MDFSTEYTEEQEEFAREVRAWIEENVPGDLASSRDPVKVSAEQWQQRRELGRKLGDKGWLYPGYPRQYGGGGLDAAHSVTLRQELAKINLGLPPYYVNSLAVPAILACGTEEQKQRLLPPILKDGAVCWQLFTEPEAGTDEANQQTNALRHVREGEYFIVNGQKIFVGGVHFQPDYLWLLTRSDLEAPRHQNLATFLAPGNLPGITIIPLDLFPPSTFAGISGQTPLSTPGVKNQVFFDDVRIHQSYLIGGEREGWKTTTVTLDVEHGAAVGEGGGGIGQNVIVEKFLAQCKNNPNVLKRLRENPLLLERMVNIYITAQIERLFAIRNAAGRGGRYGGPQLQVHTKIFAAGLMAELAEVLGPSAFADDAEWGLDEGTFEVGERCGVCMAPGGTPEALKIIISRALSIGR